MKKILILATCFGFIFTSCVSKKEFAELEARYKTKSDLLNTCTVKLNSCESDKSLAEARANSLEKRLAELKKDKEDLIISSKDLTMLTKLGASNLEKSLV